MKGVTSFLSSLDNTPLLSNGDGPNRGCQPCSALGGVLELLDDGAVGNADDDGVSLMLRNHCSDERPGTASKPEPIARRCGVRPSLTLINDPANRNAAAFDCTVETK